MNENWDYKKLIDVCEVFTDGDWINKINQSKSGIRLIQTGNIGNGYFKNRVNKSRFISSSTLNKLKCTEIYEGDLLVSRLPDPVGRSCIIPNIGERMITAVDCTIIRFNKKIILPQFANYYFQSAKYQNDVDLLITGTTRNRISRKNLGNIVIPVPPLPDQRRIVALLDQAFKGIDKARNNMSDNLKNISEISNSAINNIFSDLSKNNKEKKLSDISENLDRKRIPITKRDRKKGDFPYYGASGIVDFVDDYIFDEDLLLISEDGANLLARVYPIAFSVSGKVWVNNHAHVLKFEDHPTQRFVEYYLNHLNLENYISGMAQPKLNQNKLNSIPIPYPDINTRLEIVNKLDKFKAYILEMAFIYKKKTALFGNLKSSFLQEAFSGEL